MTIIINMTTYKKHRMPPPALLDALGRGGVREIELSRALTARRMREEVPLPRESSSRLEEEQARRRFFNPLRAAAERWGACAVSWMRSNTLELAFVLGGAIVASLIVRLIADYGGKLASALGLA